MEKQLLITGFEPFGGEKINPAWETVAALPDRIGPFVLTRVRVPVEFGRAGQVVLDAGGRNAVTPEAAALNLRETEQPDNAGRMPQDEPCVPGGENALFSTLPVRRMVQAIRDAGLPGKLSCSAGTYVCNDLLYTLLHAFRGSETRVGFVHVPFLPEQAGDGVASLPLDQTVRALEAAIGAIDG